MKALFNAMPEFDPVMLLLRRADQGVQFLENAVLAEHFAGLLAQKGMAQVF